MAAAEPEEEEDEPKGGAKKPEPLAQPSLISLLLSILILTVMGGAGGSLLGLQLASKFDRTPPPKPKGEAADQHGKAEDVTSLITLPTIITNLGSPKATWVRLEAAIVVESALSAEISGLAARVAEDTVAFLRTVTLTQLEGATGFQNLREDLNDRVRVRSEGKARELLIQTLIVE